MIITYQREDLVEYAGLYWRVQYCNPYSKTLDLRNAAGTSIDDVPFDQIKPCQASIQSATYTATNENED